MDVKQIIRNQNIRIALLPFFLYHFIFRIAMQGLLILSILH